jgi:seryl-tRNA synthetase
MLDIKTIRSRTGDVKRAVQVKGSDVDIDRLLAVDSRRRQLTQESEQFRARRNELSKQIPKLSNEERLGVIAEVKGLKTQLAALEEELGGVQTEYRALMLDVPQIPHPDAPVGVTEIGRAHV